MSFTPSKRVHARPSLQDDGSIRGNSYVALFDILGYKALTRSRSLGQLVSLLDSKSQFANATRMASFAAEMTHQSGFIPAKCITLRYADSVLLISPDASERGLVSILIASLGTLSAAMLARIPLRGAVTCGEVFLSPERDVFLGEALVRAYELEQSQDWIGAIIDEERIDLLQPRAMTTEVARDLATIEFDVPLKKEGRTRKRCINWPPFLAMEAAQAFAEAFSLEGLDESVVAKILASREFYSASISDWERRVGRLKYSSSGSPS